MTSIDDLERFAPFAELSDAGKALLRHGVVRKRVASEALIIHKGQAVSGAYVAVQGRLRVFTMAPNGTEATLYFLDPGETCVLALNCLFSDLLYPAWVQAETAAVVAVIAGPVYRRLFESESTIQNLTVSTLSTLVYRLMAELEQLHSSQHKVRLAHFILTHASSDGTLQMTQQQLARHLGTTREVVARLIGEFVGAELLRTRRGAVAIRDPYRLRRVVSADPNDNG